MMRLFWDVMLCNLVDYLLYKWHHIPEDLNLSMHLCENLSSYTVCIFGVFVLSLLGVFV
jgi:hypothetical protein